MTTKAQKAAGRPLFDPAIVRTAMLDSFRKLDPRVQVRNPVMFTVYIGSMLTTVLFLQALLGTGEAAPGFILAISLWLWFTVVFANFAEAMAEGRGKAQAATLRRPGPRPRPAGLPRPTATRPARWSPPRPCARATSCW